MLQYCVLYMYYNDAQSYEQFTQIGLAYYLPSASLCSVFLASYINIFNFFVTFFTLLFSDLSLVRLALDLVD